VCSEGACRCPPEFSGKYCQNSTAEKKEKEKPKKEPKLVEPKEEKEPIDLELGKYLKILSLLILLLIIIAIAVCIYVNRKSASRADWLGYKRNAEPAMTDSTRKRYWDNDNDKMTEARAPDDIRAP
jgi:hypothetical protein